MLKFWLFFKARAGRTMLTLVMMMVVFVVNGCDALWPLSAQSRPNQSLRDLRVVVLYHPLSSDGLGFGFEHDMLAAFAEDQGYRLNWRLVHSRKEAMTAIRKGEADLAAARLNLSWMDQGSFLPGPSYEETSALFICPLDHESESTHVLTAEDEWNESELVSLKSHHPEWTVQQVTGASTPQIFQSLKDDEDTCALVPSSEGLFYLRLFPNLRIFRELHRSESIGFLLAPNQLATQADLFAWFQKASRNHQIESLRDLYFSHLGSLNGSDELRFLRAMRTSMHSLSPQFKKIAREFSLPWRLLAAVAYQESHWNREARSFTGVRGLMMLTQATARQLGVKDRADLQQSLWGGAKYLRYLIDQQPVDLPERERWLLALANYNVGPGHVIDAQTLAENQFGLNPWSWRDLKKVLPLLSNPAYYEGLDYGEARGLEPVIFSNRVLSYYELLLAATVTQRSRI